MKTCNFPGMCKFQGEKRVCAGNQLCGLTMVSDCAYQNYCDFQAPRDSRLFAVTVKAIKCPTCFLPIDKCEGHGAPSVDRYEGT